MLVRIETAPPGPLAVIGSLPDAKLAMLEGLNGIGKSLAIRLLQLCTGTMPYRPDSPAWASLCEGLGKFEIKVTGLRGAEEISWAADSTDWKARDETEPSSGWFRSITIDRQPATLEDIQKLFVVHRMAGDEGIIETFASFADADAATTRRWTQRYAAQQASPLAALEDRAGHCHNLLHDWSSDSYEQLAVEARLAADELTAAKSAYERARTRMNMIVAAFNLYTQRSELQGRVPGLSGELARIDEQIGVIKSEREVLQRNLAALVASLARAEPVRKELKNARHTLERNRSKLTEALRSATGAASRLGLVAELEPVESAIGDLEHRVQRLREEQTALDAAPYMRELLDGVILDLAKAEERGLGSEVALDHPDAGVRLNVSQTRVGMKTRRVILEGQPPSTQVWEVAQQLEKVLRELDQAQALLAALEEVSRFRRLVATSEQRVDRALQNDSGHLAPQAQTIESQRRSKDEVLLELVTYRAAVAQRMDDQAITKQLGEALGQLDIAEERLEDEAEASKQAAAQAQVRLVAAQQRFEVTQHESQRASAAIRLAAIALAEDERLAWLRRVIGADKLAHLERPEQQLAAIDEARGHIDAVIDRLGRLRDHLAAIQRALEAVARELRGQSPGAVEYVEELQNWLAQRISRWFNHPRVRQELLPQAKGEVQVDLARRHVTWQEASGKRSRPLEAFSSGEQAFAYTRARLALFDEAASSSPNRLIVLDEFGAFIAHDRLQGLFAYLQEWAKEHANDQILIVLPLSRDYTEMARSAVPSEASRLRDLASQIDQRKYAVRIVVP
jgi:hypothetical protein